MTYNVFGGTLNIAPLKFEVKLNVSERTCMIIYF